MFEVKFKVIIWETTEEFVNDSEILLEIHLCSCVLKHYIS